jgi:molybdate transport system regulatory protein
MYLQCPYVCLFTCPTEQVSELTFNSEIQSFGRAFIFYLNIMAGPIGSKYYDIFLKHHFQLVTGDEDVVINEEGFRLLIEIGKEQSIVAAARNMNISYRKAWGMLREIEYNLGFSLVGKRRGGKSGGRTSVTPEGKVLLEAFRTMKTELEISDKEIIREFFRKINSITDKK